MWRIGEHSGEHTQLYSYVDGHRHPLPSWCRNIPVHPLHNNQATAVVKNLLKILIWGGLALNSYCQTKHVTKHPIILYLCREALVTGTEC